MEVVVSSIAGDMVNRFISFIIKKYNSQVNLDEKMERLQQLLHRVHMVVEEAEGRHLTNSRMLLELKKLCDAMYRGYHVLDTAKSRALRILRIEEEEVSSSGSSIHSFRSTRSSAAAAYHELQSALDNLETMVSNMAEFVLLLGGCERMFRSPYDAYLYADNFMFGRHVEKQQIISILLQDNPSPSAPTVLPIIGAGRVGKKTLVAHICNNQKVLSHFSSILHLNGESFRRTEHEAFIQAGRSLVVVEFTSDVDDETWQKFYSSAAAHMDRGSKIIIITKVQKLTRFGTVRPVCLNSFSPEEYSYLFKVLAFGSTNPEEHPQLASIAKDISGVLGGSMITANVYAHVLRKNQSATFWLSVWKKYSNVVRSNLWHVMDKDHPIDISNIASSPTPLRLMPPHSENDRSRKDLPKVMFGDLIAGSAILPKEEFELVAWESRIPPYKKFLNLAKFLDEMNLPQPAVSPSKKRRR
uniref:Uncharacterized protein n=1 Tax=Avena sativa TaxID=4498 RepID=A0ACD5ZKI7_AVESA